MSDLIYQGSDWDYATLRRAYDAIEQVATEELGLDCYPNRIELITSEQMLDIYTAHGMPITYRHWSYGKRFLQHEASYRRGYTSLAYEVVINSNPCISYLMEENTATMQALVIAHAAFGHNHFFRNNHLFRQWTEASAILDYLAFARNYVASCEDRYGTASVERILDAAHSLSRNGVHRHAGSRPLDLKTEEKRQRARREYDEQMYDDLWRTVPETKATTPAADKVAERKRRLGLPEENLLYFLEKTSPRLEPWEREIIRIVRLIAQYFYPQPQVKVMNEGCATWTHQRIMSRLHEKGQIDDAAFMEVLHSTSNVIMQPGFDHPAGGDFNPYALGYAMMTDIARICEAPTEEDRDWFPDIAGNHDPMGTLKHAWANYRDESFILQFLSPKVIRDLRLFRLLDDSTEPTLLVDAIHDDEGYRAIRRSLARAYDPGLHDPDVQVVDVDLAGDRRLLLEHRTRPGQLLAKKDAEATLRYLAMLWGYEVRLQEVDSQSDAVLFTHSSGPPKE
jgi:stage V sporulation protein R